jgi:hypothetical protein
MNQENLTAAEATSEFYNNYLQGQFSAYLQKGDFIKKTMELYRLGYVVDGETLNALDSAGATDDVYIIRLERNVPQRIRMFVWLEGQDVDCVNDVNTACFALGLELAGSTE